MNDSAALQDAVRDALVSHGRLPVDARQLDATANLYEAGMTSQNSVNVMLALEGRFDIEFPDHLLTRDVFSTIANLAAALAEAGAVAG